MMSIETPETPPAASRSRTVLRVALDFALGIALFSVAMGCLSLGNGSAIAGPAGWVTTVSHEHTYSFSAADPFVWHPVNRQGAMLLLALTFGAITALNMAMARHLRSAAVPVQNRPEIGR